jgi:hypothetical protein
VRYQNETRNFSDFVVRQSSRRCGVSLAVTGLIGIVMLLTSVSTS